MTVNTASGQVTLPSGATAGSGPLYSISATNASLTVLGQSLTADVTFSHDDTGTTQITVANLSLQLGTPALGATVTQTNGQTATITISPTGLTGSIAASVSFTGLPGGMSFGGSGGGGAPVSIAFAPGSLTVQIGTTTTTAVLTIAGQTLSGVFAVTVNGSTLLVGASDVSLQIGTYLSIPASSTPATDPGTHGELIISPAGIAGELLVESITLTVPGVTMTSSHDQIQVNTTSAPISQAFTIDGTTSTLMLPAGPFVAVSVNVTNVTFGSGNNSGQISGSLAFQQQTANGVTTTVVGISNATVAIGGSNVLTNGQGVLVIESTGVAGYLSGTASVAAGGVSAGGQVTLQINTTGGAVNATVTVGGQTLTINYGAGEGNVFSVSISSLSLNIDNVATLEGSISTSNVTVDGVAAIEFAGSGLTVFVGNGPAYLSDGSQNPLAQGLLITNASVALIQLADKSAVAFFAQGTVQLIGMSGVTMSGQITVRVNTFNHGFTETLTIPGGGTVPLNFGPGEDASAGVAFTSVSGTGINVGFGGQTLSADVTVTRPSGGFVIGIANASFSLSPGSGSAGARAPPIAQLSNGSGQLVLSQAGVFGAVAGTVAVNVPGVTFGGSFSLLVNTTAIAQSVALSGTTTNLPVGPYVELTGSNVTLAIGGVQVSGSFSFQTSGSGATSSTQLTASNVSLTLGAGGSTVLGLANGQGTLSVTSAGIAGSLSATVTANALQSFFSLSTVAIAFNTTNAPAAGLPAGPVVNVEADGLTLSLGGQTLSGDFAFGVGSDSAGHTVVTIAASNVSLTLGSLGGVTGASGEILVTSGNGIAASLSGTLALTAPGITTGGAFNVEVNSTGAAVSQSFTVGGQTLALSLPAASGPYIQVAATGASFSVLGQTLSGDITVLATTGSTPSLAITLANGSVSLGGGILAASALTGSLTVTSTDVSGSLSGTVALALPGVSLTAQTISVSVDTATHTVSVSGTGLTATIAGQTISGDFSFSTGTDATGKPDVLVAFSNTGTTPLLVLGPAGAPYVTVAHGDGQILITSAGVAGSLEVSGVSFTGLPGAGSLTGASFAIQLSTLTSAVTQAFTVGGTTTTLTLPAGPYVSLMVTNLTLSFAGATLQGSFAFSRQTAADGTSQITIAASGVTVSAGPASLTNGQGAFIVTSGGIAGLLSGSAAVGDSSGGAGVSGTVLLRINTTTSTLDETVPVGGQSVEIAFGSGEVATSAGPFIALSVSSLTLTIGNYVSIQGSISYTNNAFAGNGLAIFVGQGPAYLASGATNPLAVGILITDAQIGLVKGAGANSYALFATGTATVLGVSGLTVTGTVTVQFNNTGAMVNQTIPIPGSSGPGVTVNVASGTASAPFESAAVTGGQIGFLGQSLSGDFTFAPMTGGVTVTAANVTASFGGGAASITKAGGTLTVGAGGVFGSLTATLGTNITGATFGGTYTLDVNTTSSAQSVTINTNTVSLPAGPYLRVDGIGTTISLLNQSVTGNFSIETTTTPSGAAVAIAVTNLTVTLGTASTGATVTNGSGELLATTSGIAGAFSGTINVALPARDIADRHALARHQRHDERGQPDVHRRRLAADADAPSRPVSAALRHRDDADGPRPDHHRQLHVQQVTSNETSTPATVVDVGVSNGALSIGGATPFFSLTGVTGVLVLEPPAASGGAMTLAGSLSGTLALNVPGVTLAGTLALQFNTGDARGQGLARRRRQTRLVSTCPARPARACRSPAPG